MFLQKTCWIWIGLAGEEPEISNIVVSMPVMFDNSMISTHVLESDDSDLSLIDGLARRFSKRFNIQCFVSCHLNTEIEKVLTSLERKLAEILESNKGLLL